MESEHRERGMSVKPPSLGTALASFRQGWRGSLRSKGKELPASHELPKSEIIRIALASNSHASYKPSRFVAST